MRFPKLNLPALSLLCWMVATMIHAAAPVELRCEYFENPVAVDTSKPRLFWKLDSSVRGQRQTAYQILVASTEALLSQDTGDLWDSGKVTGDQSTFVRYAGKPLHSRQQCWWKVRVWDKDSQPSQWSFRAKWGTGILNAADWRGDWIASDLELKDYQKELRAMTDFGMEPESEIWEVAKKCREMTANVTTAPAVEMRHEFETTAPIRRATAYVCGLGFHELWINGARISDNQLDPAFTDYQKRVLYVAHDVTTAIEPGRNSILVILGNGWYNLITPHSLRFYAADYIAPPKLRMELHIEYADGSQSVIATDPTWKFTTDGPITFNCVLAGETFDARKAVADWDAVGFDDSKWKSAIKTSAPEGELHAQMLPPVRILERITPTTVTKHNDAWRFDPGVESTGRVRIRLHGKPGQEITVEYPGSGSHTLGRYQTDKFILRDTADWTFESRFSYKGFRYIDVKGLDYEPAPDDVAVNVVCSDMEHAGSFSCSDENLNRLQEILLRTIRNYVVHLPNDPTREKAGWTQDIENGFWETAYNFMSAPTYLKWQRDFLDAVHPNGYMPPVVPGRFDGPTINCPWWGGVVLYAPWYIYQFYGDREILEESYPSMQKYFSYLDSIAKDGVIEWGLGDWLEVGSVRPVRTPIPQTSTCAYYYFAGIMRDTAELLGKKDDVTSYAAAAAKIRDAYNRTFFNSATGDYAKGSQTSQLISLVFGLVPDQQRGLVLDRLVKRIADDKNHLTTGFVGTPLLLTGLSELEKPELAWTIATQKDYPSFIDAVLNQGHSVMKEDWKGGLVQMPSLQGPIGTWYFHSLAGIRLDPKSPGFHHFILKPELVGDLTWARGEHETLYGRITSSWKRDGDRFAWDVIIPPNTTATIFLPTCDAQSATESDKPIAQAEGIRVVQSTATRLEVEATAGSYSFVSKVQRTK